MKKILIIALTAAVINITGCSSAQVEKAPVTIGDTNINTADPLNENTLSVPTEAPEVTTADGNNLETAAVTPTPAISPTLGADQTLEGTVTKEFPSVHEPEYTGTIELEGTKETVNYKEYDSSLGYSMYYDKDRFTVTNEYGIDNFITENADPEMYPYVYINISKLPINASYQIGIVSGTFSTDSNKVSDHISTDNNKASDWTEVYDENHNVIGYVNSKYENFTKDTVNLGIYEAEHYKFVEGKEWNSVIKNYYYIKSDKNLYLIETQYFLEAEEGFGARISAMLDTLSLE